MSRRKHGGPVADLAEQTKIMLFEKGSSGLKEYGGFVSEAYNSALYWPRVQPIYSRLRRSMPEMVVVRQAFSSWARNVKIRVDLPENPTDDDKAYQDFVESVFDEMDGGFGAFIDTVINNVPFYGWGWFTVVPGRRESDFNAPGGDDWQPESDDGLIGLRRLAWRDPSSFYKWEMEDKSKRLLGMWQQDIPNPAIMLPLEESLHLTFGDPNNPEGLSPLEAVYRLERIKYGLEVINGIGFEHAAGYVNVQKTETGQLTKADLDLIANAAKAILTGQQGNYAAWPYGITGEVKDIAFAAGPALLAAIQYYGVLALSCYTMQWIALSATTGAGSYAAMTDSSSMGVFTFNSMLDGFASQLDAQVGKRLYEWNKLSFRNLTKRPTLAFTHIDKEVALNELGQFVSQISSVIKLGEDDIKAIREHIPFLPDTPGQDQAITEQPLTPEQIAQQTNDTIQAAINVYRAPRAEMAE
jgi:hypothetical protein